MKQKDLERLVIDMLLTGDAPVLEQLREQYKCATIWNREFTGVGFFTRFHVPDKLAIRSLHGRIDDVDATINDTIISFILWIDDGKIYSLEAHLLTPSDPWPADYPDVRATYSWPGGRRYLLEE